MATTVGRGGGKSPANVTKNLKGIDFHAQKQDLVKHAQQLKAEKVVIDEIQMMEDREYTNMADVMKSFGKESQQGGASRSSSQKGQPSAQAKTSAKSHSKSSHQR